MEQCVLHSQFICSKGYVHFLVVVPSMRYAILYSYSIYFVCICQVNSFKTTIKKSIEIIDFQKSIYFKRIICGTVFSNNCNWNLLKYRYKCITQVCNKFRKLLQLQHSRICLQEICGNQLYGIYAE